MALKKSYKNYLTEYEQNIKSDPIMDTDDIMYSNSRALDIYSQGKRFKIENNAIFYELVKIVKDVIDRHFYQPQVQLNIQIADKEATFRFIFKKNDIKNSAFVEMMLMYVKTQVFKQFKNIFKIEQEDLRIDGDDYILIVKFIKTENANEHG